MLACPRNLFVPQRHRAEALLDRPIRLEELGFNVSAPHVQVGACGCGLGRVMDYQHDVAPLGWRN